MAAKKKSLVKGKVVASECCAPCGVADTYKPRLYLNLQDKDVSQIKGLTVGEEVTVLVTGTVKGLEQRERTSYDEPSKTEKTGEIQLENYRVEVTEDEANEFAKMADEEEGG
jgi:hypothetical protein